MSTNFIVRMSRIPRIWDVVAVAQYLAGTSVVLLGNPKVLLGNIPHVPRIHAQSRPNGVTLKSGKARRGTPIIFAKKMVEVPPRHLEAVMETLLTRGIRCLPIQTIPGRCPRTWPRRALVDLDTLPGAASARVDEAPWPEEAEEPDKAPLALVDSASGNGLTNLFVSENPEPPETEENFPSGGCSPQLRHLARMTWRDWDQALEG